MRCKTALNRGVSVLPLPHVVVSRPFISQSSVVGFFIFLAPGPLLTDAQPPKRPWHAGNPPCARSGGGSPTAAIPTPTHQPPHRTPKPLRAVGDCLCRRVCETMEGRSNVGARRGRLASPRPPAAGPGRDSCILTLVGAPVEGAPPARPWRDRACLCGRPVGGRAARPLERDRASVGSLVGYN